MNDIAREFSIRRSITTGKHCGTGLEARVQLEEPICELEGLFVFIFFICTILAEKQG
jgi:hypothetical protein